MKTLKLCLAAAILLPMSLAARAAEEGRLTSVAGARGSVHGRLWQAQFRTRLSAAALRRGLEAIKETKILEKALQLVTSRMSQTDVEQAQSVLTEVKQAAAAIDGQALLNCQELIYAQLLEVGTATQNQPLVSQHLFLLRLTPESATKTQEGITQLLHW